MPDEPSRPPHQPEEDSPRLSFPADLIRIVEEFSSLASTASDAARKALEQGHLSEHVAERVRTAVKRALETAGIPSPFEQPAEEEIEVETVSSTPARTDSGSDQPTEDLEALGAEIGVPQPETVEAEPEEEAAEEEPETQPAGPSTLPPPSTPTIPAPAPRPESRFRRFALSQIERVRNRFSSIGVLNSDPIRAIAEGLRGDADLTFRVASVVEATFSALGQPEVISRHSDMRENGETLSSPEFDPWVVNVITLHNLIQNISAKLERLHENSRAVLPDRNAAMRPLLTPENVDGLRSSTELATHTLERVSEEHPASQLLSSGSSKQQLQLGAGENILAGGKSLRDRSRAISGGNLSPEVETRRLSDYYRDAKLLLHHLHSFVRLGTLLDTQVAIDELTASTEQLEVIMLDLEMDQTSADTHREWESHLVAFDSILARLQIQLGMYQEALQPVLEAIPRESLVRIERRPKEIQSRLTRLRRQLEEVGPKKRMYPTDGARKKHHAKISALESSISALEAQTAGAVQDAALVQGFRQSQR